MDALRQKAIRALWVTILLGVTGVAQAAETPLERYQNCMSAAAEWFQDGARKLAVLYPRFGVAWQAYEADIALPNPMPANFDVDKWAAETKTARDRFTDRILQTAEPDALQWFQLFQLKAKQRAQACGPMPPVGAATSAASSDAPLAAPDVPSKPPQ